MEQRLIEQRLVKLSNKDVLDKPLTSRSGLINQEEPTEDLKNKNEVFIRICLCNYLVMYEVTYVNMCIAT